MQNASREHSAKLLTFIKLPFVFKTFVLSFSGCLRQVLLYNRSALEVSIDEQKLLRRACAYMTSQFRYIFPAVNALCFSLDTIFVIYTLHHVFHQYIRVKSGKFGHQVLDTHLQTV